MESESNVERQMTSYLAQVRSFLQPKVRRPSLLVPHGAVLSTSRETVKKN